MGTRTFRSDARRRRGFIPALAVSVVALIALTACSAGPEGVTAAEPTAPPATTAPASSAATQNPSTDDEVVAPTLEWAGSASPDADNHAQQEAENTMQLTINGRSVPVTLEENSSVDALRERLTDGPVTLEMADYGGMEKVGPLGFDLPTNNVRITTAPGDVILYQGSALVIYYGPNTWSFTRLGRLEGVPQAELESLLNAGGGPITVTLSLD